ncbi:MAG TPA: DUF1080 domain-containing protein [Pirellulaceae bacterium]|jgi:hypothetical protein|nr:DUF1080 domain-containing protein [Pirellulaceae bacterium]
MISTAVRALAPLFVLLATFVAAGVSADEKEFPVGEWVSLFNGKDLTGWTPKIRYHEAGDNFANTFRVNDGLLQVRYDGYEQFDETFGHLFYETPFSHYKFRVEYRFVGDQATGGPGWAIRNSGVMIHGESPQDMTKDQNFPASVEVQLLGGPESGTRTTANLCTPGTHVVMNGKLHTPHCLNSKSETYRGDQWVTVEIEVHGAGVIKHFVNGEQVMEYEQAQLDEQGGAVSPDGHVKMLIEKAGGEKQLTKGSISLQSESHPIDFRKVEIMVLEE